MAELPVVAVLVAKPGSEDFLRAALTKLVAPSRAEPGCLRYELYESASAPGTFVTVETWRDQAAFDAHMLMPHLKAVGAAASDSFAGPPSVYPLMLIA